jgi:CRP/FNR family cyclic AMP-dependent transcriptional regulator
MVGPPGVDALSRSFVLRGLPREELEGLASTMHRRTYRRGEAVFHQGDPGQALHVVYRGRLKIVLPGQHGEEAVLTIVGPGDLFGDLALLDGAPRSASVVALEPVETAVLSRADFVGLLRRSPTVVDGLLATLAQTIRRLSEEVADLTFLDLHARLAKKLLELAEAHGRPVDGALEIQVPLTQEELASMIGATRPRVNKLLGLYEDRGAIARRGRHVLILKPELLRGWALA